MDVILEVEYTGMCQLAIDADLVRMLLLLLLLLVVVLLFIAATAAAVVVIAYVRFSIKQHMWMWKCTE